MPTLIQRLSALAHQTIDAYPGAWLAWCDPNGHWARLLAEASQQPAPNGFALIAVDSRVNGHVGGLADRKRVAELQAAQASFVLLLPAAPDQLGWLWAEALMAERIHTRSLREVLMSWGWRPQSLTLTDDEIVQIALQHLHNDPTDWGGSGVKPDTAVLLEALAGASDPQPSSVLALTIEQAGLPPLPSSATAPPELLAKWRTESLARLLVTEARLQSPAIISPDHAMLISEGQRRFALDLLTQWRDSVRLSRSLANALIEADRFASLATAAVPTPESGPFLSRALEASACTALCARLEALSGRDLLIALADITPIANRHVHGFWGDSLRPQALPWSDLERLSIAARAASSAGPPSAWVNVQAAIDWYTRIGWKLDRAGEEFLRPPGLAAPALDALLAKTRAAFRSRWESILIDWSTVWSSAGCKPLPLPRAGEWLAGELADRRPTAVIVIDAFRYDAAMTLAERVNTAEGASRTLVQPAAAPLPSITALGMGSAMPLATEDLSAEYDGKQWHLTHGPSGLDLSVAEQRRTWWKKDGQVPADGILTVAGVLTSGAPNPSASIQRLVLTDDLIDKLGHDDQLELLGTGLPLDRYTQAVARLRDAGWRRVLIVTDHGYIHWTGSADQSVPAPQGDAAYKSRRALAWPATVHVTVPHIQAPGGRWTVAPAPGASSWSAYGGLGYFHGGASLQEWVIPCVRIEWPSEANPVDVVIVDLPQVLSERPAVTLSVRAPNLFAGEALARQIDVVIRDKNTRTILFRSGTVDVRPIVGEVRVTLTAIEGTPAERGSALVIEARDASSESIVASADSTLMIALSEW